MRPTSRSPTSPPTSGRRHPPLPPNWRHPNRRAARPPRRQPVRAGRQRRAADSTSAANSSTGWHAGCNTRRSTSRVTMTGCAICSAASAPVCCKPAPAHARHASRPRPSPAAEPPRSGASRRSPRSAGAATERCARPDAASPVGRPRPAAASLTHLNPRRYSPAATASSPASSKQIVRDSQCPGTWRSEIAVFFHRGRADAGCCPLPKTMTLPLPQAETLPAPHAPNRIRPAIA
jgi:hypothetical protein